MEKQVEGDQNLLGRELRKLVLNMVVAYKADIIYTGCIDWMGTAKQDYWLRIIASDTLHLCFWWFCEWKRLFGDVILSC